MSASLGHVEHDADGGVCVHRVVRLSGHSIEFVTLCGGQIAFGFPATSVALREQFRRKLVTFETITGNAKARYVTPEQRARRAETPAQRRARTQQARAQRAAAFEAEARLYIRDLNAANRAVWEPLVTAIAAGIRAGTRAASAKACASFLEQLSAAYLTQESTRRRVPREQPQPRASARSRPWFVSVLALSAWPCDATAVKAAFAARALKTHPDHGGNSADFIEAKRARDEALSALEWRAV